MANDAIPHIGSGPQVLKKWIEQLVDKKIAQYARSNPLQFDAQGNVTIPGGNSLTVTGGVIIDGTLESGNYQQGSAGYLLSGSQISTYTSIQGFSGGQAVQATGSSFGLTTTMSLLGSTTFAVPNGFTRAVCTALGEVYAINPNTTGGSNSAGGDALYAQVSISTPGYAAVTSSRAVGVSGSNGFATAYSIGSFSLTGLTGGQTVTLGINGQSGYRTIAASSTNYAEADLVVLWLP